MTIVRDVPGGVDAARRARRSSTSYWFLRVGARARRGSAARLPVEMPTSASRWAAVACAARFWGFQRLRVLEELGNRLQGERGPRRERRGAQDDERAECAAKRDGAHVARPRRSFSLHAGTINAKRLCVQQPRSARVFVKRRGRLGNPRVCKGNLPDLVGRAPWHVHCSTEQPGKRSNHEDSQKPIEENEPRS